MAMPSAPPPAAGPAETSGALELGTLCPLSLLSRMAHAGREGRRSIGDCVRLGDLTVHVGPVVIPGRTWE